MKRVIMEQKSIFFPFNLRTTHRAIQNVVCHSGCHRHPTWPLTRAPPRIPLVYRVSIRYLISWQISQWLEGISLSRVVVIKSYSHSFRQHAGDNINTPRQNLYPSAVKYILYFIFHEFSAINAALKSPFIGLILVYVGRRWDKLKMEYVSSGKIITLNFDFSVKLTHKCRHRMSLSSYDSYELWTRFQLKKSRLTIWHPSGACNTIWPLFMTK